MLVIKRKMVTIKQLGKMENVCQRLLGITYFSKNNNLKNVIKNIFDVDFHHNLIKVWIEEGSIAKKDGLIAFRGQYSKLMEK